MFNSILGAKLSVETKNLKDSKTFCMIPWIHLHVMPDSSVIPCCVSAYDDIYGNGTEQSLKEIWNSEKYKQLRKNMLAETPSPGCQRCYTIENSGFESMRNSINQRFSHCIEAVKDTEADGTFQAEGPELQYIDIRFSNLCNFKCRGCGPALSSSWFDDHQRLFNYKSEIQKVKSVSIQSPSFWEELKEAIPNAEEIYFGGGEPLITKDHFEILKILEEQKKFDIRLSYNTNLAQLNYMQHNLAEIWSKFKFVKVGISIDDMGARAEYFRHGTKWKVIEENFNELMNNHPTVNRYVNCTVNIMNVLYLPELFNYLIDSGIIDTYNFNINLLLDPEEYCIQVLPAHIKLKVKDKLGQFKSELFSRGIHFQKAAHDFDNILNFLDEKDRSELMPIFKDHTLKLDQIRKENFTAVYPELSELVE